jgi:hypothetical protein
VKVDANSIPRTSPMSFANVPGQPPTCPPKIICSASRWRSLARSSMNIATDAFVCPSQMFPLKKLSAITESPSNRTSP